MLMRINEISTIGDALFYLGGLTKRPWSEAEFAREVIRMRLPIYAIAPAGATIVRRERIDGKQVVTPRPDLPATYVTLLQDEIEQLARGGQTITHRPAWVFGDEPYRAWSEIETHRAANHRVVSNWDADPGEWMGESDSLFFANPIGVTPDTTLAVPRCTIAELAKADLKRQDAEYKPTLPTINGDDGMPPAQPHALAQDGQRDAIAGNTEHDRADNGTGCSKAVRGITKDQVVTAFGHLTAINLANALANGKGLFSKEQAKVTSGTRGGRHAALWDPVLLAVGFNENYQASRAHLSRVFTDNHFLTPWWEEWMEQAEDLA